MNIAAGNAAIVLKYCRKWVREVIPLPVLSVELRNRIRKWPLAPFPTAHLQRVLVLPRVAFHELDVFRDGFPTDILINA